MDCFQVTLDGPAASGKSTIARRVAARLGGVYVNTGDMYRTLGWQTIEAGIDPVADPQAVIALLPSLDLQYVLVSAGTLRLHLNGQPVPMEHIRCSQAAKAASQVAALPAVRDWLQERQRSTASLGIVVMEGRDIGTIIFPEAAHKFFITASPLVRAQRRLAQGEVPDGMTLEDVAKQIAERDLQDETRAVAPLRPAADAITITSDGMEVDEVVNIVINRIQEARRRLETAKESLS